MFCEKCGARMPDDSLFCEKCGTRVQSENPADSNPSGNAFAGTGARTGGQVFSNPHNDSSLQWAQNPSAENLQHRSRLQATSFRRYSRCFSKHRPQR